MAKKTAPQARQTPVLCGVRGCTAPLRPRGQGLGCTGPQCSNYHEKWAPAAKVSTTTNYLPGLEPVDDRAALLAAIKAKKGKRG